MSRAPDTRLSYSLRAATAEATRALGEKLGRLLEVGDVIALIGPLGSGKTTFAQGIAAGVGVPADRPVASPTFALVHEHPGRVPFVHADFYRIERVAELAELGLEQAYDRAAAALEWADRFPDMLPQDHLAITFVSDADGGRQLRFETAGSRGRVLARAVADGAPVDAL